MFKETAKVLGIALALVVLVNVGFAQNVTVSFLNGTVIAGPKYQFDVYLLAGTSGLKLGTSNIAFSYNTTGFGTNATATIVYSNFSGGLYQAATFTNLATNKKSINIELNSAGTGTAISDVSPGTKVATIEMNITNGAAAANLASDVANSPLFADDEATLLTTISGGTDRTPLPVEMTGFVVTVDFRSTELAWETKSETNNSGFEVERREVGVSGDVWTKVGFVPGAGTSTSPRKYSFTDANLAPGRYAYQVKQVDNDGTFSYSGSLEVEVGVADKVLTLADNFPNPFNPSTSIEFAVPADGKVLLKVFNVLGQEVATLFDGVAEAGRFHQARFDASSLPTGLYFSRLEYDGKSMMKKMLLTK